MEVLLSAMNLVDWRYIETLNITSDVIIINQCDKNEEYRINRNGQNISFYSSKERGLSRSRNMAIKNASSEICILCDNDVEYVSDYDSIIEEKFLEYPDADLIVFYIKRDEKSKPYVNKDCRLNHKLALKVFSPEIAFRKSILKKNCIEFNEKFGAGSTYMMGEENIFLYECLRKGLKIMYTPTKIAELRYEESTWKINGRNEKFFKDKGACYYAMEPKFSTLMNIQFVIRKKKLYEMSMLQAFNFMQQGKKEYRHSLGEKV